MNKKFEKERMNPYEPPSSSTDMNRRDYLGLLFGTGVCLASAYFNMAEENKKVAPVITGGLEIRPREFDPLTILPPNDERSVEVQKENFHKAEKELQYNRGD